MNRPRERKETLCLPIGSDKHEISHTTDKTTEELGGDAAKTFPSIGSEKEFSKTKLQNPVAQRKDTGLWQDIERTWRITHQHNTQCFSSIPRWQTRVPLFSEISGQQQSYSTLSS